MQVQLPTYVRAANTDAGMLVCVAFDDRDLEACAELSPSVENLEEQLFIRVIGVDARQKPSASKG